MPAECGDSVLNDPLTDKTSQRSRSDVRMRRLAEIQQHLLRSLAAAEGLRSKSRRPMPSGSPVPRPFWKDVGQRRLDERCTQRAGSQKDDGCWPSFG